MLHAHENDYYVPRASLADFLAEISITGGAEIIWHVEGCDSPPAEAGPRTWPSSNPSCEAPMT